MFTSELDAVLNLFVARGWNDLAAERIRVLERVDNARGALRSSTIYCSPLTSPQQTTHAATDMMGSNHLGRNDSVDDKGQGARLFAGTVEVADHCT
jgi:hypothetical protein